MRFKQFGQGLKELYNELNMYQFYYFLEEDPIPREQL